MNQMENQIGVFSQKVAFINFKRNHHSRKMNPYYARNDTPDGGIIILGNAGSGKSYICNLLIGHDRFKADFQPEAVTTETEHHQVLFGSKSCRIYNIPGLIEVNQEQIDRNKREIVKAFEQCPTSVVIFVWTQIGGRAQPDDAIAFNALKTAYQFPPGSLMFIVNNIPVRRPGDYEAKFLTTLGNLLRPVPVSLKDTFFLDTLDPSDTQKIQDMRAKLYSFIDSHHVALQRKCGDIILQSDHLKQLREELKKQQQEAERNREENQRIMQEMTRRYALEREERERSFQKIQSELRNAMEEARTERKVKSFYLQQDQ